MKTIIIILFLSLSMTCLSQKSGLKYNRPFVIYEGCDDEADKENCFNQKSSQLIFDNLTDSLQQKLINRAKKDTITISTRFLFDETGEIMINESVFYASVDSVNKDLKYLITKFPRVKPVLDNFDRGVSTYFTSFYGFTIDSSLTKLVPIPNFKPKEVPLSFLEKVPVFKGCDASLNNEDAIKCLNKILNIYIQKNFRSYVLANDLGLSPGINSIFLFFNIEKNGDILMTNVTAPHPVLKSEGIRLLNGLPKALSPGYLNGEPIITPYFLPIRFVIEDDAIEKKTQKN